MRSWHTEAGSLACQWSEAGPRLPYRPRWMKETTELRSGYLAPLPDFARHSPFGGGTAWFQLHCTQRVSGAVVAPD